MSLPLSAFSLRNIAKTSPIQLPGRPEIVADRELGGPEDPADRRLVLDTTTLRMLLDRAEASSTSRVVIHQVGFRVQTLADNSGHRWDHVTLLGLEAKPEVQPGGLLIR